MGVRIQELPETTGINKEDVLIVEDGQGTKKGTVQQLDETLGVSQLKEDLVANTKEDAKTKRSLSALWDLNNGISYRFENDSEKAYQKKVLSGAKLCSVNRIGGHIIKQDDTLLIGAVNNVIEKGRNLFDCYGFSSKRISSISGERELSNNYGTSISTIEPDNRVIVKQNQAPNSNSVLSDSNGFFYIGIKGMVEMKNYILSFDFTPTRMLLENSKLTILVNGRYASLTPVSIIELNVKKRVAFSFEYKKLNDFQCIEIRISGMSGTFENFQIDEGNVETAYTPYYAPISHPIPQSILSLDGYGWSAGTAYNYVDFENKIYYKCVDRINLDSYKWEAVQKDSFPFYYTNISINELNDTSNVLSLVNVQSIEKLPSLTRLVYKSGTILNETNKPRGYLYFELTKPIVTDISDIIGDTFQEPFEVETDGSLTFKNTNGDGYQIAVPSDIQYTVALSEVNS